MPATHTSLPLSHHPPHAGAWGRAIVANPWVQRLVRFGMFVRGIIYFVPGVSALLAALGRTHQSISQQNAIDVLAGQPAGKLLLLILAVGLAGYSLWGVIRAVVDPLNRGRKLGGLLRRFGYLTSATGYVGLLVVTAHYILSSASDNRGPGWAASIRSHPLGTLVVAVIGLCWIFGAGLAQIVDGWREAFMKDFDELHMGPGTRTALRTIGRIGLIGRGIVFTVIGVLLLVSANHASSAHDISMNDALMSILHRPFGRALLALAGLGLMIFGGWDGASRFNDVWSFQ